MSSIGVITAILIPVPKSAMTTSIPTVTESSTSSQAHLLPSTFSFTITTTSGFQPSVPIIANAPTTSNNLCTSVASSLSNTALSSSTESMFSPLPAEKQILFLKVPIPSTCQAKKRQKPAEKK
ncbi:hypothetical protein TNCV_1447291 [Trichonephila clavipes]|nr:hypothetical protein TNCV_1447291 [Trichonephila clavipes]